AHHRRAVDDGTHVPHTAFPFTSGSIQQGHVRANWQLIGRDFIGGVGIHRQSAVGSVHVRQHPYLKACRRRERTFEWNSDDNVSGYLDDWRGSWRYPQRVNWFNRVVKRLKEIGLLIAFRCPAARPVAETEIPPLIAVSTGRSFDDCHDGAFGNLYQLLTGRRIANVERRAIGEGHTRGFADGGPGRGCAGTRRPIRRLKIKVANER